MALSQVRHFDAFSADRERPFHLGVVIPLRPASTARSWPTVVARLRSTVGSLLRQTARESTAVIVGQENPDRLGASPRLSMITTTAPPPAAIADRCRHLVVVELTNRQRHRIVVELVILLDPRRQAGRV